MVKDPLSPGDEGEIRRLGKSARRGGEELPIAGIGADGWTIAEKKLLRHEFTP